VLLLLLLLSPWQQPRNLLVQFSHGLTNATSCYVLLLLLNR
jgi:hypothetical protein